MTINEVRKKYLEFLQSKQHKTIASASLLPENDPTTLFTGSGMQPLVPYLLGQEHPEGKRLADSQKCFRSQDIDEVGDNRHTTFFEMLGNWSLGDYFKKEQIQWIFEFLTNIIGLDPTNIYISVFKGNDELNIPKDTEAAEIWQEIFLKAGIKAHIVENSENEGMQNGKIFYYDETKNWWSRVGTPQSMPNGEPGGPDSEIFWDFGANLKIHENSEYADKPCHINCDCGRFMEIGNNVFMQYLKTENGFEPLPHKNVDFGGGLERIAAASENNPDIFMLDVFNHAINTIENLSHTKYSDNQENKRFYRIIMDHIRAATFLIADGAIPSNKDQGYFTRRLIRRAIRFTNNLGINKPLCETIGTSFVEYYKDFYPLLKEKHSIICSEISNEEAKFAKTIERGLKEFNKILNGYEKSMEKTGIMVKEITGKHAFKLFDTYGFPLELTIELAQENNMTVDVNGFQKNLKKHQEISKKGAEKKFKGGLADNTKETTKLHTATHLLHQALRTVLGNHVEQRGSNITPERLRFDFSHPSKMTDEEKKKVEDLVNSQIKHNHNVKWEEMTLDEARKTGAIGLFEEKYGNKVKVYTVGDFSKEICGGPHVEHTSELGKFKIKKEEASSAGVRRIKAILE